MFNAVAESLGMIISTSKSTSQSRLLLREQHNLHSIISFYLFISHLITSLSADLFCNFIYDNVE